MRNGRSVVPNCTDEANGLKKDFKIKHFLTEQSEHTRFAGVHQKWVSASLELGKLYES